METFQEMAERRRSLIRQNRAILDRARSEGRPISDAEETEISNRNGDISRLTLTLQADRAQSRQEEEDRRLQAEQEEEDRRLQAEQDEESRRAEREEVRGAFEAVPEAAEEDTVLTRGCAHPALEVFRGLDYERAFSRSIGLGSFLPEVIAANRRQSLDTESDSGGNFLMPPARFVDELLQQAGEEILMRSICRVWRLRGRAGISYPRITKKPDRPPKTSPLGAGTVSKIEGRRDYLIPKKRKTEVLFEEDMMEDLDRSPEQILREAAVEAMEEADELDFMLGDGVGQKGLGLFFPSDKGVPTSRDFDAYQYSDKLTAKGLRHQKNRLKRKYRRRGVWVCHTDVFEEVQILEDLNGRPLFIDSIRIDEDDQLLSRPVYTVDLAPSSTAPGSYHSVYFDPNYYWVVDGFGGVPKVKVLDQVYHKSNEIAWEFRMWSNHAPVLDEAFSRGKRGTSPAPP